MWPHGDLIGPVFGSRWCRLQQKVQKVLGTGPSPIGPANLERFEKWLRESCEGVVWQRVRCASRSSSKLERSRLQVAWHGMAGGTAPAGAAAGLQQRGENVLSC